MTVIISVSVFLSGMEISHLREPEVKVLDASVEVLLLVSLFQFLALFCRFVDEELPLFIQSIEAHLGNRKVKFE